MITFKIIPNLCVTWVGKNQKIFGFFFILIIIIKIGWKRKWEGMARNSCPVGTCNNAKIFERVE